MGFDLPKYVAGSLVVAGMVVYHAFATREQFFPAMYHLSTSKVAIAVLGNLAFALALCLHNVMTKVFLGSLRESEIERINDRISQAVMETCLAMTIFREEFNVEFVAMFTILTFVKVFHWLVQDRVDYIETTPTVSRLHHLRILSFMAVLLGIDSAFLQYTIGRTLRRSASVHLLFAFEYVIQASIVVSTFLKYALSVFDNYMEGRWENKGVFVFYLELVTDMLHLFVYMVFFIIVFTNYGLPLHLVRDLYWTFRNFRNRVADFLRYRRVTANMDERFQDASEEDLVRCDGICIICREEMAATSRNKKLPCNHVFHLHCLRSWLERQQNCPICRTSGRRASGGAAAAAATAEGVRQAQAQAQAGAWAAANYGYVWNMPQWVPATSMALYMPAAANYQPFQYAGQQMPENAAPHSSQAMGGMMPLLPFVMPPTFPAMMPPPPPAGATPDQQQQHHAATAAAAAAAAAASVISPYGHMMMPPTMLAPGGPPGSLPLPVGPVGSAPMSYEASAAAANAAAAAAAAMMGGPHSNIAVQASAETMEQVLRQQLDMLQAQVSHLQLQRQHSDAQQAQQAVADPPGTSSDAGSSANGTDVAGPQINTQSGSGTIGAAAHSNGGSASDAGSGSGSAGPSAAQPSTAAVSSTGKDKGPAPGYEIPASSPPEANGAASTAAASSHPAATTSTAAVSTPGVPAPVAAATTGAARDASEGDGGEPTFEEVRRRRLQRFGSSSGNSSDI
ncbi:hypothetical protein WJX72_006270 [[Myrmecia] bisecta]|uniref:RING-type E3 ubiquitin transferase n=1 Tax=[Myrmecia] bisecta TaxID=41462 RepID=A0AAW1P883_9CHLO